MRHYIVSILLVHMLLDLNASLYSIYTISAYMYVVGPQCVIIISLSHTHCAISACVVGP